MTGHILPVRSQDTASTQSQGSYAQHALASIGLVIGFAAILLTVSFESLQHAAPFPSGAKCKLTSPLSTCWDGLAKTGGYKCPTMLHDTVIRGQTVPAGSSTCYKAVYWNTEPTTLAVFAWLLAWVAVVLKAYDRMLACLLGSTLRFSAAAAVITGQVSLWYGFHMMIQYTNDFWFNFYRSQLFFTLSEALVFCTMVVLLHRSAAVPQALWYTAAGTSSYHILQLVLDEGQNLLGQGGGGRLGRDTHMLVADVMYLVALRHTGQQLYGSRQLRHVLVRVGGIAAAEWLLFQACFSDAASGHGGVSTN